MYIDNDKHLWKATDYKREFGIDDKADFYDKYLVEKVWPNTFAKAYNKEIDNAMTTTVKDQINPDHYQGIVGNYQYIECMEFILGKEGLKKHLLGQIYKYLMRMGKKDNELQEVRKVVWYTRCLEILERDGTIIGFLGELK
jgi:hypothetical protein